MLKEIKKMERYACLWIGKLSTKMSVPLKFIYIFSALNRSIYSKSQWLWYRN